jgi:hypothetical protein
MDLLDNFITDLNCTKIEFYYSSSYKGENNLSYVAEYSKQNSKMRVTV